MSKSLGLQSIPLDSIVQSPNAHRIRSSEEKEIQEHAIKISQQKALFNKFSVFQHYMDDGSLIYYVGDGAGRLESLKIANQIPESQGIFDEIVVEVFEPVSDSELEAIQMAGNLFVKKTVSKDLVNSLMRIMHQENLNYEELAQKARIEVSLLKKILRTISMPPMLREAIEKNKSLTLDKALQIQKYLGVIPKTELEEWIKKAENLSLQDLIYDLEILKKNNAGLTNERKTTFVAIPKFRGKAFCESLYHKYENQPSESWDLLKLIFSMDTETVTQAEKDFELAKKKRAENAADKETQKIKKAVELASKAGFTIVDKNGNAVLPKVSEPEAPEPEQENAEPPEQKAPETSKKKAKRRV